MHWDYEKMEDGKIKYLPAHDYDGKITGKIIIGIKFFFDENPEEAHRLGWIKHIKHDYNEINQMIDYNPQTQNLFVHTLQVDEYTIEDIYSVAPKSEEQLALEELLETMGLYTAERIVQVDDAGGVVAGWN